MKPSNKIHEMTRIIDSTFKHGDNHETEINGWRELGLQLRLELIIIPR